MSLGKARFWLTLQSNFFWKGFALALQLNPSACHYVICYTFNWSKNKNKIECLLKTTGNTLKQFSKVNWSKLSENCLLYYAAQWFVRREREWCNTEITISIIHRLDTHITYLQIKYSISFVRFLNIFQLYLGHVRSLATTLTNQPIL